MAVTPDTPVDVMQMRTGRRYETGQSVMHADVLNAFAEHLDRLEAKLDALILALKAGAIGDWRG